MTWLSDPYEEAGLAEMQSLIETGGMTSLRPTEHYLERIAAIDASGPALHSVIEVKPRVSCGCAVQRRRK
jgi:hypothetical protein